MVDGVNFQLEATMSMLGWAELATGAIDAASASARPERMMESGAFMSVVYLLFAFSVRGGGDGLVKLRARTGERGEKSDSHGIRERRERNYGPGCFFAASSRS